MKRIIIAALACILMFSIAAAGDIQSLYTDVTAADWFYANISSMSEGGYLNGYPDGSFRPDAEITAAEFVSVAARVYDITPAASANNHWAGALLSAALNNGWYDWDEIPPTAENYDKPIRRELAVKIVMRAFLPNAEMDYVTQSARIKDFSQLDGRYYNEVLAAYSEGVAGGDEMGNFNPRSSLTRAEACALIMRASGKSEKTNTAPTAPAAQQEKEVYYSKGGISQNGRLSVQGTQLVNERGEGVVLRGMSSHGIQWFGQFLSRECIKSTAECGANLFRIAMYTEEGGYIQNSAVKQKLIDAVDTANSLDMYAIIDWHILSDGNPKSHIEEAEEFFTDMARRYKDSTGVLYEICNEPNGNITWSGDVKPYAERVISAIRSVDENAVILVGSPTWSQDLHEVKKDPLSYQNIMYTCHFYSGTHTQWLRDRISDALDNGLPVFVTEWGTSDASGGGGVYRDETEKWLNFMDINGISWANWSLCDKAESSAAVRMGANISDGISDDELSESGSIVWQHFSK